MHLDSYSPQILTSVKVTQSTVNIKPIVQQQILVNEHWRQLTLHVTRDYAYVFIISSCLYTFTHTLTYTHTQTQSYIYMSITHSYPHTNPNIHTHILTCLLLIHTHTPTQTYTHTRISLDAVQEANNASCGLAHLVKLPPDGPVNAWENAPLNLRPEMRRNGPLMGHKWPQNGPLMAHNCYQNEPKSIFKLAKNLC